jgi:HlyD family secretion protein
MSSLTQANPIEANPAPQLAKVFAPRRRGRRRLILVLAVLMLGGGGVAAYLNLAGTGAEQPQYRTEAPSKGPVVKQVSATGTLSPLVTVSVGSQVSGRIKEILVDYNSVVEKGQVIARLDDRTLLASRSKARANVTAARANLVKARAAAHEAKLQYERDRGLAAKKVVAPAEVESRLATYKSATAQVTAATASLSQAQAALNEATINVAYATIVSPIDGVVVSRSVDVGQTVTASLQAPTLFLIAEDLRKMEVHTSVAESDVGLLAEGMPVRFTVDAYANRSFDGVVKQVRYEAQTVQNVVTYDAVVSVDNAQLKLRPGMTANVTFIIDSRDDVLRVPTAALRYKPTGAAAPPQRKKKTGDRSQTAKGPGAAGDNDTRRSRQLRSVWVLVGGKPQPRRIKVGLSDGTHVEVLEGELSTSDKLITAVLDGKVAAASPQAKSSSPGRGGRGRIF